MLKPYSELIKVDVTPYCEERDGMLYLNWAMCIKLLHDNGAEKVHWEPIQNEKTGGSLYFTDVVFKDKNGVENRCYETRIRVTIDDDIYEMQSPVMNGVNPVKDNSMSQQRVWNSMCRSFVKCVAINTGLGFHLWLKEEFNRMSAQIPNRDQEKATDAQLKMIRTLQDAHPNLNFDKWIAMYNFTWDTLTREVAGNILKAVKERYGDE